MQIKNVINLSKCIIVLMLLSGCGPTLFSVGVVDVTTGDVVVNGRPLHNNNSTYTTNFTLHYSEEENLVMRILQLCGIIIQKPGLVEVAMTDKAQTKQSQND